jgi:protoheme ferro-lyase
MSNKMAKKDEKEIRFVHSGGGISEQQHQSLRSEWQQLLTIAMMLVQQTSKLATNQLAALKDTGFSNVNICILSPQTSCQTPQSPNTNIQ